MVLVPCRECGKQISTEAPTCPHAAALIGHLHNNPGGAK